ncbi:hypothetical protein JAAARDRAFT_200033 [Jaapia argillacea MUCL 33604]|uniref:Uncharacterized protein n=1 Tax=Jaapia argillacea MUCL 33604 TaxID=933084 RepID=A0A067PIR4_9AGAM|nr:hypothetical protein JAAARDRAFT_200033 [Jaapia argillacea MUCL 33604]
MYKHNNTGAYMRTLGASTHACIRKITRRRNASGAEKHRQMAQVQAEKQRAMENKAKVAARKAKKAAKEAAIDGVVLILDVAELRSLKLPAINLQLQWHRRIDQKEIPPQSKLPRKENKLNALIDAVNRYKETVAAGAGEDGNEDDEDEDMTDGESGGDDTDGDEMDES